MDEHEVAKTLVDDTSKSSGPHECGALICSDPCDTPPPPRKQNCKYHQNHCSEPGVKRQDIPKVSISELSQKPKEWIPKGTTGYVIEIGEQYEKERSSCLVFRLLFHPQQFCANVGYH